MKIGLFRGSFDPPHYGHIFGAIYALKAFDLDRILIAPVYNHPFGKKLTSFERRLGMTMDAFADLGQKFQVTGMDKGNSSGHCIDFINNAHLCYGHLIDKDYAPDAGFVMLGGTDTDANKGKYQDEEEILKLCTVARMPRSGYSTDPYAIPNYSSSEIKKLIKLGEWEALAKMMPRNIISYIQTYNLYKEEPVVSKSES